MKQRDLNIALAGVVLGLWIGQFFVDLGRASLIIPFIVAVLLFQIGITLWRSARR